MKLALDLGHGCKPDTGANGIRSEEELINELGELLIPLLKKNYDIVEVRPKEAVTVQSSLLQRCHNANSAKAEIYISLHFNAFNGKAQGIETYSVSAFGSQLGFYILKELEKLGFANRGNKSARFAVLTHTVMPAILIENCFCDSKADMQIYNPIKQANAIMTGLGNFLRVLNTQRIEIPNNSLGHFNTISPVKEEIKNTSGKTFLLAKEESSELIGFYDEENRYKEIFRRIE